MSARARRGPIPRACAALLWAALGASGVLLGACGAGSSAKLIPVANSEPLQRDFEEVARAAEAGHGSCTSTETAIIKLETDYRGLPASIDAGLRRRLDEGVSKLRSDALELCVQPPTGTATTGTPRTTTPATTTPTTTAPPATTPTTPTTSTPTTTTPPTPGGGTPAPKENEPEGEEAGGKHDHKGAEGAPSGGAKAGGGGEASK